MYSTLHFVAQSLLCEREMEDEAQKLKLMLTYHFGACVFNDFNNFHTLSRVERKDEVSPINCDENTKYLNHPSN